MTTIDQGVLLDFDKLLAMGTQNTRDIAGKLNTSISMVKHLRLPYCVYKARQSKQFQSLKAINVTSLVTFIRTIPGVHFNIRHAEVAQQIIEDDYLCEYIHTSSIYEECPSFVQFYYRWQESLSMNSDAMSDGDSSSIAAVESSELEAAAMLSSISKQHCFSADRREYAQGCSVVSCNADRVVENVTFIARLAVFVNDQVAMVFPYTYTNNTLVSDLLHSFVKLGNHPSKFSFLLRGQEVIPTHDARIADLGLSRVPLSKHQTGLWNNLPVFNIYLTKV